MKKTKQNKKYKKKQHTHTHTKTKKHQTEQTFVHSEGQQYKSGAFYEDSSK